MVASGVLHSLCDDVADPPKLRHQKDIGGVGYAKARSAQTSLG
jgi:hypothetical protein